MSNWEKFKEKQEKVKLPHREVGGMYQCQSCNVFVMNATFFPTELILKYTCSEGHESFIENFRVLF